METQKNNTIEQELGIKLGIAFDRIEEMADALTTQRTIIDRIAKDVLEIRKGVIG